MIRKNIQTIINAIILTIIFLITKYVLNFGQALNFNVFSFKNIVISSELGVLLDDIVNELLI
jgi:hypothetical protein